MATDDEVDTSRIFKAFGMFAVVVLVVLGCRVITDSGGDGIFSAPEVQYYQLDEVATLDDGTTIAIDDVREELGAFGARYTEVTITYVAGENGHHPTMEKPVLTPSGGEPVYPYDGMFATTSKGLSEVLTPGMVQTLVVSYEVPIADLSHAQLSIDGELFAGNFAQRIGVPGGV